MSLRDIGSTNVFERLHIVEDVGGTNAGEDKTGIAAANVQSAYYQRDNDAPVLIVTGKHAISSITSSAKSFSGAHTMPDSNIGATLFILAILSWPLLGA